MEGESSTEIGATYGAPQQQDTEARPTVACLRCRDQKLRCDRDVPSCMRCRKQRAVCKYPSPPNRRRIAQKTSEAKAAAAVAASQVNVVEHVQQPEVSIALSSRKKQRIVENDGKDEIRREHIPDPNLNHTSEDTATAELPSTEVGLLLLEIYFKRVYNATLLFHKTVAFQLYRQDGIPGYLLRAIFAHAATFLEQVDSPYEENIKIIPMPKLSEKSWSWARAASREALSYADEPTLVRIQALQVLELYYFSRGEIHRSIIHASLAYKLSQLLGYDRLHGSGALPSAYRNLQFDHEIKRRCFWASWCSILIGSQPLDSSRVCEKVMGLPLPARLGNGGLAQAIELKLGQRMGVDWTTSTESSPPSQSGLPPCSLMAELIKLLGIWTKVKAFICEPLNSSDPQRTVQLNKLTELLDREGRSLNLPLTKLQARAEVYEESPELLTSVTSVYYLSQMLLYASRVPMFSGRFAESADSRKSVQQNGEMTFQHATGFAELLKQFASEDLDITRLWPFVGYATFVAGSVFVSAGSGCQSGQVPVPLSEELKTIKTTLGVLSIYWKPLRILVRLANAL
ncbi:hypothetical protein TruAng_004120 [Truncatella angustata]|nr:hypothetical protein TruAng_004120 [Truncatella angustata]